MSAASWRFSTRTPSVSSSSRRPGSSSVERTARSTDSTKPGLRNCRAETFTARRSVARLAPGLDLATALDDSELAERVDQIGVLGDGHELYRRDPPPLLVM